MENLNVVRVIERSTQAQRDVNVDRLRAAARHDIGLFKALDRYAPYRREISSARPARSNRGPRR